VPTSTSRMRHLSQDLEFNRIMSATPVENQTFYQSMANVYANTIRNLPPLVLIHDAVTVMRHKEG
jgi:hypothetical protein